MSARLLAGARAVLRREGLVRALDLAARRPLGDRLNLFPFKLRLYFPP